MILNSQGAKLRLTLSPLHRTISLQEGGDFMYDLVNMQSLWYTSLEFKQAARWPY